MPETKLNLNIGQLKEAADRFKEGNYQINLGGSSSRITPVDSFSKYDRGFIPSGSFATSGYGELMQHRAGEQSNWDKFGNMLTRGIAKAGISAVEPIGYLLDLEQMFTATNEVEEEYGNRLNQWLMGLEENLDAALPIYTHEDKPNIGSSDWWFKNGDQMIKSIGYIVPGGAIVKGTHKALQGAKALNALAGATGAGLIRKGLPPIVSAIALNYNEHMRSAAEVFGEAKGMYHEDIMQKGLKQLNSQAKAGLIEQEEYETAYSELVDHANNESKVLASKQAEFVVQAGKANIPLELIEQITLFKYMGGTRAYSPGALKSLDKVIDAGLVAAGRGKSFIGKGIQDIGLTAGSEYFQEVHTGLIEKEAIRRAAIDTGQPVDDMNLMGRYADHFTSYEGLTEGISGLVGGAGMQMVTNIGSRTARRAAHESLLAQAELENNPVKFKEIQTAEFLDNHVFPSFDAGTTGNLLSTLDGIMQLNQEQASSLELDSDYATKAQKFKDITLGLEKAYNDLSIRQLDDPFARSILMNLKRNSIVSRQTVFDLDAEIDETTKKLNKDEVNHPLRQVKDLHRDIVTNASLLTDALVERSKLKNDSERSIESNETRAEIDNRVESLGDRLVEIKKEQTATIDKYLKQQHPEAVTKFKKEDGTTETQEVKAYLDEKFNVKANYPPGFKKAVEPTVKKINEYLNNRSDVDRQIDKLSTEKERYKSIRDNSERLFSLYDSEPKALKERRTKEQELAKQYFTEVKTNIDNSKTKSEVDKATFEIKHPDILAYAEMHKKKLDNDAKVAQATKEANEKSAKDSAVVNTDDATTPNPETAYLSSEGKLADPSTTPAKATTTQAVNKDALEEVSDEVDPVLEDSSIPDNFKEFETTMLDVIKTPEDTLKHQDKIGKLVGEITEAMTPAMQSPTVDNIEVANEQISRLNEVNDNIKASPNYDSNQGLQAVSELLNSVSGQLTELIKQAEQRLQKDTNNEAVAKGNNTMDFAFEDTILESGIGGEIISTIQAQKINGKRLPSGKNRNYNIIEGAISLAYLDVAYLIDDAGILQTADNKFIDRIRLLHTMNLGSRLKFVIDDSRESELTSEKGSEAYINELPIKVLVEQNDKWVETDTFLHTTDWVVSKVAPETETKPNNKFEQEKKIKEIRKHVYESLTSGKEVLGKLSDRTQGHIQYNVKSETAIRKGEKESNLVVDATATKAPVRERLTLHKALPGVHTFAIVKNGMAYTSDGQTVQGLPNNFPPEWSGLTLGIFDYMDGVDYIPIFSNRLGDNNNAAIKRVHESIMKKVELYLNPKGVVPTNLKRWLSDTDKDGQVSGLVTYLREFINVRDKIKLDAAEKNYRGYFGTDSNGNLVFGINHAGVYYNMKRDAETGNYGFFTNTNDKNAKTKTITLEAYLKAFDTALRTMPFSVNLNKINKDGEYRSPVNPSNKYESYNSYIKDLLTTSINGRLPLEYTNANNETVTQMIPYAQPNLYFDMDGLVADEHLSDNESVQTVEVVSNKDQVAIDKATEDNKFPVMDFNISDAEVVNYNVFDIVTMPDTYLSDVFESREEQITTAKTLISFILPTIYREDNTIKDSKLYRSIIDLKERINNITKALQIAATNYDSLNDGQKLYLKDNILVNNAQQAIDVLPAYEKINDNFDKIVPEIVNQFNEIGFIDESITEEFSQEDDIYELLKHKAELQYQLDPKSLSKELRMILYTIPEVKNNASGKPEYVLNSMNRPRFTNVDYLYDNLLYDLAGKAKTIDEAIEILKTKLQPKPVYNEIISRLQKVDNDGIRSNATETLRTLFSNHILKAKEEYIKTISYPIIDTYDGKAFVSGRSIVNLELNQVNAHKGIINSWSEFMKRLVGQNSLFVAQKEGSKSVLKINGGTVSNLTKVLENVWNSEEIKYINKDDTAYTNDTYLDEVVTILGGFGIQTDRSSLMDAFAKIKTAEERGTQVTGRTMQEFVRHNTKPVYAQNKSNPFIGSLLANFNNQANIDNPFTDGSFNYDNKLYSNYILRIAKATYDNNNILFSLSSLNSNNDIVYSIQPYSRLTSLLKDIKSEDKTHLRNLLTLSIAKNSPLLNRLLNDASELEAFDIKFFDKLNIEGTVEVANQKSAKHDRNQSGSSIQNNIALNLFQNRGLDVMMLPAITFGDSSKTPVIAAKRQVFDLAFNNNTVEVTNSVVEYFYNYLSNEIARVTNSIKKDIKTSSVDYNNGSRRFIQHAWLDEQNLVNRINEVVGNHKFITKAEFNELYINGEFQNTPANTIVVKRMLKDILDLQINNTLNSFVSDGTLKFSKAGYSYNQMDVNYNKNYKKNTQNNSVMNLVGNFVLNNYAMNIDQQTLLISDPAHFTVMTNGKVNYQKTYESLQKRLKSALSPTLTPNKIDSSYSRIVVNDPMYQSTIKELQDKGYNTIKSTDGFEWLSDVEYMKQLKQHNLVSNKVYNSIMDKIRKAEIDNPNNPYYELTGEETLAIQVLKPLSFSSRLDIANDVMHPTLLKSAFLGMFPELTKGNDNLDKLRILSKQKGIDRISYQTASKIKDTAGLNLYENGKIKDNAGDLITSEDIITHTREFDGLQSTSPHSKTQILTVIQANRNLFYGIRHLDGFNYKGKPHTAKALEIVKEKIRIDLFNAGETKIKSKLGIHITPDGKVKYEDLTKIKELLHKEASNRNWQVNAISSLKLTDNKQEFVLPLIYNSEFEKVQSLLFSAVNKELVKHKLPGASYVQIPGHDFKSDTKVTDDTNKKGIVYVTGYDNTQGLQFIRRDNTGIKRAQVIVSWNFRDAFGNDLNMNDFMLDGKIDYNKLPKELLEGIGFRIPNQSHSTMLPFEIVGFLPSRYKDVVIVPSEIVDQMGSDFDIDKLYSYLNDYYYNPVTESLVAISREDNLYKNKEAALTDLKNKIALTEKAIADTRTQLEELYKEDKDKYAAISDITRRYDTAKRLRDAAMVAEDNQYELEQLKVEVEKLDASRAKLGQAKAGELIALSSLVEEFKNNIIIYKQFEQIINNKLNETAFLKQDYIDVHNSVLTHPDVYDYITNKLDYRDLYDEAEQYINKELVDINSWLYQRDSYIKQQVAQDLISTFVLNNSMASLLESKEHIKLSTLDDRGNVVSNDVSIFKGANGEVINLNTLSGIGRSDYNGIARNGFENFVMFINLVVDNANNPVAGHINVNYITADIISTLLMLKDDNQQSVGIKEILAFINQPAVKDVSQRAIALHANNPNLTIFDLRNQAIESVMSEYGKIAKALPVQELVNNTSFTYDQLIANKDIKNTAQFYDDQTKILQELSNIGTYANEIVKLRRLLLNHSKTGVGKNYGAILESKVNYEKLLNRGNNYIGNVHSLFRNTDNSLNEYGHYLENSLRIGEALGEMLGYKQYFINDLLDAAREHYSLDKLDASKFNRLLRFVRTSNYAGTSALYGENVSELRTRLMLATETNESLAERTEDLQNNPLYQNNAFLRTLYTEKSTDRPGIDIIKHRFASKLNIDRTTVMQGLNELLASEDADVRSTAQDIIKYTFVIGQPFDANYQQDIQFDVLEKIGFFNQLRLSSPDGAGIFKSFIQHNVKDAPEAKDYNVIKKTTGRYPAINTISMQSKKNPNKFVRIYETIQDTQTSQRRSFYSLFEARRNDYDNGVYTTVYTKIPIYGGINKQGINFVEGDVNNPNAPSLIQINNIGVEFNTGIPVPRRPETKVDNPVSVFNDMLARGNGNLTTMLANIKGSPLQNELAAIYGKVLGKQNKPTKVIKDNSLASLGLYDGNIVTINEERHVTDNVIDKDKLYTTLIHESNHVIVGNAIEYWEALKSENPTSVNAAITKLDTLRNELIDKLSKSDGHEFIKLNIASLNQKLDALREDLSNKEILDSITPEESRYYGFHNNKEFIAKTLEGKAFARFLDSIQYSQSKTLLQEITDLLQKIVTRIIENFGFNITKGSALEAAIVDSMNVLIEVTRIESKATPTPQTGQTKLFNIGDTELGMFPSNNIKPGVSEVFESNPKLANAVYEAMGFGNTSEITVGSKQWNPDMAPDGYSKIILLNNEYIGEFALYDIKDEVHLGGSLGARTEIEADYKGKGYGYKAYLELAKQAKADGKVLVAGSNQTAEARGLWTKLVREGYANKITRNVEGFVDFQEEVYIFDNSKLKDNQITPQQKQQAQQAYSNYLDTIFPDSKVKLPSTGETMILYHGTNNKFDVFSKEFFGKETIGYLKSKGFWFTHHREEAENYGKVISVLLNMENPYIKQLSPTQSQFANQVTDIDYAIKNNFDSAVLDIDEGTEKSQGVTEYVVFEPEQIHILGSKQDIQGFTNYINKKSLDFNIDDNIASIEKINVKFNNEVSNSITTVLPNLNLKGQTKLTNVANSIMQQSKLLTDTKFYNREDYANTVKDIFSKAISGLQVRQVRDNLYVLNLNNKTPLSVTELRNMVSSQVETIPISQESIDSLLHTVDNDFTVLDNTYAEDLLQIGIKFLPDSSQATINKYKESALEYGTEWKEFSNSVLNYIGNEKDFILRANGLLQEAKVLYDYDYVDDAKDTERVYNSFRKHYDLFRTGKFAEVRRSLFNNSDYVYDAYERFLNTNPTSTDAAAFNSYVLAKEMKQGKIAFSIPDGDIDGYYQPDVSREISPTVKRLITNINHKINSLKYAVTKNITPEQKSIIKARIDSLYDDKNALIDIGGMEAIEVVGNKELQYVEDLLEGNKINPTELKLASHLLEMWQLENSTNMLSDDQLSNTTDGFYPMLEKLSSRSTILQRKYDNVVLNYALQTVAETTGGNVKVEQLQKIKDVNEIISHTLDLSMANNVLAITIDDILKRASNNQIFLKAETDNTIATLFNKLKNDKAAFAKVGKDYELFWQVNTKGEQTGRITDLYSDIWAEVDDAYKRNLSNLRSNKYNLTEDERKTRVKDTIKNFKHNTITIDLRFLGKVPKGNNLDVSRYVYKSSKEYRDYLTEQFGQEVAERLIQEAYNKYSDYIKAKDEQFAVIDLQDDITSAQKQQAKQQWEDIHDPIKILDFINDDVQYKNVNSGIKETYVLRVPKKKDKYNKVTGFYDSRFDTIMQDKTLSEFYNVYREMLDNAVSMYPELVTKDLAKGFLPGIHKDSITQIMEAKGTDKIQVAVNKAIQSFTTPIVNDLNAVAEREYIIKDDKNKQIKTIPVKYMGRVPIEDRSKDLEKLLSAFTDGAINYDFKNQIRDQVEVLWGVLNKANELETNANNQSLHDMTGRPKVSEGKNMKAWTRYTMDALLYGETSNRPKASNKTTYPLEGVLGIKSQMNNYAKYDELVDFLKENTGKEYKDKLKRYELAREIESLRDTLDKALDDGDFNYDNGQTDYMNKMEYLQDRYKELGGKNLVYANVGEFLMKVTQMKGMGLNLTAGIANVAFGTMANFVHANGRKEFNYASLLKAQGMIMKSMMSRKPSDTKQFKVIEKLDLLFETIDTRVDKPNPTAKYKAIKNLDPYIIQHKTEYFIQGSSALARMLYQKVNTINGPIPVYELFDDNGDIRTELLPEGNKNDWSTDVTGTTKNELTKLRTSIIQTNKYLHGNYDPSSRMLIKKTMLGKMVMQFRSWIPMGVANRLYGERHDLQLGRDYQGRWRAYGKLGFQKSIQTLLKQVTYQKDAFNGMSELDIESMRKNLAEIISWAGLALIILALKASMSDDDEEKNAWDHIASVLANQLYRAEQDVYFYFNPLTVYQILRDPLPVTKSITDVLTAINATMSYISDPEGYRGQPIYQRWMRTIPILTQYPKTVFLANNAVSPDKKVVQIINRIVGNEEE